MIIDAHSHGFHGKYFDRIADVGGNWTKELIATEKKRAKEYPQYLDVPLRIEWLNKYGIDLQVVTPSIHVDVNLFPGDDTTKLAFAKAINDNMARLMDDSKGKLLAIGTIPVAVFEQGGRQEMERALKALGLKAVSIPSNISGIPLDSTEFEPFWAQVAEMNTVVYIHPQNPASSVGRSYEAEYDLLHTFGWPFETTLALCRLVFSGVMERYTNLKIVAHHLGGMVPFFWGRILETYRPSSQQKLLGRVISTPLLECFSRFYYDTAVGGSAAAIKCAYEVFGADKLVFATDAPFGPDEGRSRLMNYPNVIRSLILSQNEIDKILSGNARKIFDL